MTLLHQLYTEGGQSPWIDNLSRDAIRSGRLANMLDDGIRGVTSNPTIFQKAMTGTDVYSADFARLIEGGTVEQAFWEMATADVTAALEIFHPLYVQSGGGDGFISLEVSPRLAYDTEGTIKDARIFHERIAMPNLLVKIPATEAGVPAIRQMISEGRNINVTLIFSLDRYNAVIEAYISGLETFASTGGDLSRVHSVASFFVSRVDTEVDRRLETLNNDKALSLRGKAAVAQAKLAYQLFLERFSGPRWEPLKAKGAHVQRPLWASTSTKNPAYPDLLYVDTLIGPRHRQHDARRDSRRVHGPRDRGQDGGPGSRRGSCRDRGPRPSWHRYGRRLPQARRRRRRRFLQELRRAAPGARGQSQRAQG